MAVTAVPVLEARVTADDFTVTAVLSCVATTEYVDELGNSPPLLPVRCRCVWPGVSAMYEFPRMCAGRSSDASLL